MKSALWGAMMETVGGGACPFCRKYLAKDLVAHLRRQHAEKIPPEYKDTEHPNA